MLTGMLYDSELARKQREPFRQGETVIIIEPEGRRHYVQLQAHQKFHHSRMGFLEHDRVIGQPPGVLLQSDAGFPVVCLRPTLEDFILRKLNRKTSIIHPKDLATILMRGEIFSGARVLEAGIGSGSAAIMLLRHIGPGGRLVSYERRPEFIELALENIRTVNDRFGDPGAQHVVEEKDVYDGIDEADLDLVLLDVPEPHRSAPHALEALRPGGVLLCWLPTVTQVYLLVRELQRELRWAMIETGETLHREWNIAQNAMRPFHRMIGHTGFLIRARKLAGGGKEG